MRIKRFFYFLFFFFAGMNLSYAQRPNVIVILADDLGNGDVGYHNQRSDIPTPNIDALAASGVHMTAGYVTAPVCGPSRAGLCTGVYQNRFGFEDNPGPFRQGPEVIPGIPTSVPIFAELFKQNGYTTGMVGKWHQGGEETNSMLPSRRGFDEFFGFIGGASAYFINDNADGKLLRGETPVDAETEYLTDAFGREAVDFISRHQDEPFFLYVAFNAVHGPLQAPQDLLDQFTHIEDEKRRILIAMQHSMDLNVGKIDQALKDLGLEENTLVIFTSDNGGKPDDNHSFNDPYLGEKGTLYEGGVRLPYIMKWKGKIQEDSQFEPMVSALDIMPTALSAANISYNAENYDGKNLLPHIQGMDTTPPHDYLYWRFNHYWSIRDADWKLHFNGQEKILINISQDIGESQNLITSSPEVAQRLEEAWNAWASELPPVMWGWNPALAGNYRGHFAEDFEKVLVHRRNPLGKSALSVVENPHREGINLSERVLKVERLGEDSQSWMGIAIPLVLPFERTKKYVHLKIKKDRATDVFIELRGDAVGQQKIKSIENYTQLGEWQDMVFDVSAFNDVLRHINILPDHEVGPYQEIYIDDFYFSDDASPVIGAFDQLQPNGLKLYGRGQTEVQLTWNPVSGAQKYYIFNGDERIGESEHGAIRLEQLQSDGVYHFTVEAENQQGQKSLKSEPLEVRMPEAAPLFLIEDFEGETVLDFRQLGQTENLQVVNNPSPDALNASSKCFYMERPNSGAPNYSGTWADVAQPFRPVDRYLHMKVLKERISPIKFKFEGSRAQQFESLNDQTRVGEWEDIVFDISSYDGEVSRIVIQPDFEVGEFHQIYIDDIWINIESEPHQAFDQLKVEGVKEYEVEEYSAEIRWNPLGNAVAYDIYLNDELLGADLADTLFALVDLLPATTYEVRVQATNAHDFKSQKSEILIFSTLEELPEGDFVIDDMEDEPLVYMPMGLIDDIAIIDNPNPSGINTSSKVLQMSRLEAPSQNWAGVWAVVPAFDRRHPYLHVKIMKDHLSQPRFGLIGPDDQPKMEILPTNTAQVVGQWVDYVFDFSAFAGQVVKLNIQPDFENGARGMLYVDDILMNSDPNPIEAEIDFEGEQVVGLKVDKAREDRLYFSWAPLTDALAYEVYQDDAMVGLTEEHHYHIENLIGDTEYVIKVRAKNAEDLFSQFSEEVNARTLPVLNPEFVLIENFEKEETLDFKSLGNMLVEGVVDNPLVQAQNPSYKVLQLERPEDAQEWAGAWADVTAFDRQYRYVHVKVLKSVNSQARFSLEAEGQKSEVFAFDSPVVEGEWTYYVFDFDDYDGLVERIAIQPDMQSVQAGEIFIDDIYLSKTKTAIIETPEEPTDPDKPLDAEIGRENPIFPNPVKDKLFLKAEGSFRIHIMDLNGQKVFTTQEANLEKGLDVSFLRSGIYLMVVQNDHAYQVFKFLKE
ncbi:sulfatase-like hydrolase/transferase [Persicobacter diffluens]